MARSGMAAYVSPATKNGPLREHAGETIFDWLRRQQNPTKPNTSAVLAMASAAAKKNAPKAGQGVEGEIPEGTNS